MPILIQSWNDEPLIYVLPGFILQNMTLLQCLLHHGQSIKFMIAIGFFTQFKKFEYNLRSSLQISLVHINCIETISDIKIWQWTPFELLGNGTCNLGLRLTIFSKIIILKQIVLPSFCKNLQVTFHSNNGETKKIKLFASEGVRNIPSMKKLNCNHR